MTLLLLRHGESEGNVRGVIQGWRDYALTERGREQAEAAARRLAGSALTAVYSSPLRRARETADVVADALGLPVQEEPALREYHFGEAEGLPWDEARRRWLLDDHDWGVGRVPGEEGTASFRSRVTARIEALAEAHRDDSALCVVHGGVISALLAALCGLEDSQHPQVYTGNCGITTLGLVRGSLTLLSLNDCCHLDAEAARATPGWQAPATR